jgi:hypothetical protein
MGLNVVSLLLTFVAGSEGEFDVWVGAWSSAGSEQQWWRSDMPRSLAQEGGPHCAPRLLPTGDPRAHPAYPGRPAVDLATAQPFPRRRPSPGRRLRWPSTACASFEHHALTLADDGPVVDTAGDHADPRPSSRPAAWPTAALHDLTPVGQRTRERTDTGRPHRTPTPGRSDARTGHRTGTCGHWTLAPDTGRRTLAEDADRVTKARPASGSLGPTMPSDRALGRPKCSCGRRLQRSAAHAGSA